MNAAIELTHLRLMRPDHLYAMGDIDVQDALVDAGLARFIIAGAHPVCDEPLAYLAMDCWLRGDPGRAKDYIRYARNNRTDYTANNGFVNFVAIYLAHNFSKWRGLKEIFEFGSNEAWERGGLSDKRARLVAHYQDYSGSEVAPVSYTLNRPASGCSAVLGVNAVNQQQVIDWLHGKSPNRAPFCFPPSEMGPDILLSLEIEESFGGPEDRCGLHGARLLIAVKVNDSTRDFAQGEFQNAIRSITPAYFYRKVSVLLPP